MSLTTTQQKQLDIAFKKLLNKSHINAAFGVNSEAIGTNVSISTASIFGEAIASSPSATATSAGANFASDSTVEHVRFVATADPDSNVAGKSHAYKLSLPSDYTTRSQQSNKSSSPFGNNAVLADSLGKLQIIPPSFGSSYAAKPYRSGAENTLGGGNLIGPAASEKWVLDYYAGILYVEEPTNDLVTFVDAYLYIGKMADEVSGTAGADGEDGADGVSVSSATVNGSGELEITLSNSTVLNAGNVKGTNGTDGTDGSDGVSITGASLSGSDLVLTLSSGSQITVSGVKGADGSDGSNGSDGADGTDGTDGISITGASLSGNDLILTRSGGESSLTVSGVKGADGTNGSNGADGSDGADGVSITGASLSGNDLILTLSSGSDITVSGVKGADGSDGADGADGVSIQSAALSGNDLVLTLTNSNQVTVTGVKGADGSDGADGSNGADGADGADGVSITGASLNGSNELVLTRSSGADINVGNVKGDTGPAGPNIAATTASLGSIIVGSNLAVTTAGTLSGSYSVGDGGLTQKNFTTDLHTKLVGIETSADVTDAVNVAAAGAVMEGDTTTASFAFVKDEDDLGGSSSSDTVVPTQQSVKAYVDALSISSYAPLASPALTGVPTAPTASTLTDTTQIATTAFVQNRVDALIDGAPGTLNTLNELAAAIGDDANYASGITTSIAAKADKTLTVTGSGALEGGGALSTNPVITVKDNGVTNAMLENSTISGVALGGNLANLSVDDSSLQLDSGTTFNGSSAKTLSVKSEGISNAHISSSAGIVNSKLANSSFTVSDGSNSTAISLGGTATFSAGEGLDVVESSGTVTFSAEEATSSNKGVASFSSDNFDVSSGVVTIKDGGVILGTETTGNYVSQAVAGNGIDVSGATGDVTISIGAGEVTNSMLAGGITAANLAGSIGDDKLSTISTANKVSLSALDIDSATGTTTIEDSDLLIVDDGADGTNRKIAASVVKAYAQAGLQSPITVVDSGGDGSLSMSENTITYTGPSAAEVRAHFSASGDLTYSNGQYSYTSQWSASSGSITTTNSLSVPSNLTEVYDMGADLTNSPDYTLDAGTAFTSPDRTVDCGILDQRRLF